MLVYVIEGQDVALSIGTQLMACGCSSNFRSSDCCHSASSSCLVPQNNAIAKKNCVLHCHQSKCVPCSRWREPILSNRCYCDASKDVVVWNHEHHDSPRTIVRKWAINCCDGIRVTDRNGMSALHWAALVECLECIGKDDGGACARLGCLHWCEML